MKRTLVLVLVLAGGLASMLVWLFASLDRDEVAPLGTSHVPGAASPAAAAFAEGEGSPGTVRPEVAERRDAAAPEVADAAAPAHLRLRVLDADGAPIAGAAAQTFDDSVPGAYTTADDGTCTLAPRLTGDRLRVRVDHGARHVERSYPVAPEVVVTLPWAGILRGRLVDAETGSPVAGRIEWRHETCTRHCEPERAVAGADGAFELRRIPRGRDLTFALSADGHAPQSIAVHLPGRGEPIEHVFRLRRGVVFSGRIVDAATRRAVANATVAGEPVAADGSFRRRVLPHEASVFVDVAAPGFCTMTLSEPVSRFANAEAADAEYGLPVAIAITGVARGDGGQPVAGAQIRAAADGVFGPRIQGTPEQCRLSEVGERRATSGPDGVFRIDGLVPNCAYRLTGKHDDHHAVEQHGVRVLPDPAAPAPVVAFVAKPALGPTGTIVGSYRRNGRPCRASLHWIGSSRQGACDTDGGGTFRIEKVQVGRVGLTAIARDFLSYPADVQPSLRFGRHLVVEAGREHRVEFDHALAEAPVRGRVTYGDGQAAADVAVGAYGPMRYAGARTGPDGVYELMLPTLLANVEVRPDVVATARSVRPGDEGVDFVVPRMATLRWRVAGEPDLDVTIRRRREGQARFDWAQAPGAPDPDGWRTASLRPGNYVFVAYAHERGVVAEQVHVDGATSVEFRLPRALRVTVQLAADGERPAAGWTPFVLFVPEALGGIDGIEEVLPPGFRNALTDTPTEVTGLAVGRHLLRGGGAAIHPAIVDVTHDGQTFILRWQHEQRR
jgi:protocatechuate 3,4-dioxygenase beta subunit